MDRDDLERQIQELRRRIAELEEQRRQLERQLAEARTEVAAMVPPTSEEELTQTLARMFSRFARLLQAEVCFFFVHRTDE
ncbi:MAG: hypothetical protein BKPUNTRY_002864, partial [Candidatus Fervidibacter sp.]